MSTRYCKTLALIAVGLSVFCSIACADGAPPSGLYAKLGLRRVVGVRILRSPEGDHSSAEARTFVAHDAKLIQSIDDNLKKLPVSGTQRRISAGTKTESRRLILIDSDGREVSVTIDGGRLLGTFKNQGPAGAIVSAVKQMERQSEARLERFGKLPIIDAVVTASDPRRFPNAGAGAIRAGDRIRIDLSKLTERKWPTPVLRFSSRMDPQRKGWLTVPSAMACERVRGRYRGEDVNLGYRLVAQGFYSDSLVRIDVLGGRSNRHFEITISYVEHSFIRGMVRLEGKPVVVANGE